MVSRKSVVLLCALVSLLVLANPASTASPDYTYGPKVKEIIMPIISDTEARIIAIRRGDVDILPDLTRPSDINALKDDPNIELTMDLGFHMFYMAFNMRQSPMDNRVLREAIAHTIDRDQLILSLFEGYVLPLSTFVPQSSPYFDASIPVYEYDPDEAKRILDEAGYVMDGKSGVRLDPATGKPLREIKLLTPTYEEAPTSAELGKIMAESAQAVGIPLKATPMDFNTIIDNINNLTFDAYVLAWSLSRNPTYLHSFFHSKFTGPGQYNIPGIAIPELDEALDKLRFAPDKETAMAAASKAQEILAREVPYITLYSRPCIDAYRTDRVAGYKPMLGYGSANYKNKWTTLSIRSIDGDDTIRWLLASEPKRLHPCLTQTAYEAEVYGRTIDNLVEVDLETMEDIPWLAKDWDVDTWEVEPGKKGTKITYYLERGVKWHDGEEFNAEDVKFTIDFLVENEVPLWWDTVVDVVRVETPDKYTVEVYLKTVSYFHLSEIGSLPWMPEHIWKDVEDWEHFSPAQEPHPTVEGLTKLVGMGPFVLKEYVPGEYVRLERFEDYWRLQK